MKFNIEMHNITADTVGVEDVTINVEYNADELRTLLVAYEKMIPMFIDLILKAAQQPTA